MIWHVQNENFILDSTRIFMKAFHLLLFDGSLIFPECILIFGLILLLMIDSTSDQKDIPWLYFISSTSLVMSITALLFRWREEPMISFSGNFQTNNFNEIFQFLILLCSTLCIPLSVEYIECTEMAITEFILFVLKLNIAITRITKPYRNPNILAEFIAGQLKNRVSFRKAMKKAIELTEQADTKGIQVQISGRIDGKEIARVEWIREGRVPLQTIRAKIDYCSYTVRTIYGVLGIKIWIFIDKEEE
ncbi:hypothetical protein CASFOL_007774 [Castilleja foliolosa]|uniref:Small ribosomal subunit protein uS3c n=1 Tax=Castilleja foliolosa TaxID=1961234 RepID=A0ABD3E1I2_9LAMI